VVGTGSGMCPVAGCGINSVELSRVIKNKLAD
jgi:hypothetical protein